MNRMMQGYEAEGKKSDREYHGKPHPYSHVCDYPVYCKPIGPEPICEEPHETTEEEDACEAARVGRTYEPPPDHYATGRGIQPWDVWDAFDLDRYTANATKYLLRAGKKPGEGRVKDLKKALNYVLKAIEMAERDE